MNFVQTLEESLRDLAAEARKKHPGVKEASERATMRLRVLKNAYVSAVRQANSGTTGSHHPTTSMFQSSDLLHPFLLAANYPNASPRLLELSFRAMKLLMEGDAIVPTDSIQLIRVWMIQAKVVSAYYTKQYSKEKDSSSSSTTEGISKSSSTGVSSSWFSWGASASSAASSNADDESTPSAIATQAATPELPSKSIVKNAVSSSSGQTGQASPSQAQMEKLALEILSCLLQLLELMRNYPAALTPEVWSNAVALSCIWLGTVPSKHKIHQAAHSTIAQIISLLYHPDAMQNSKFLIATWDDLLALSCGRENSKRGALLGAFSLCKKTPADNGLPSPDLALELMCQVWKEGTFSPIEKTMVTTMSRTLQMLEQLPKSSVAKSLRVAQWSLALFKAQAKSYPNECRELFMMLVKAIPRATEACRNHHDFEDGYVYTREEARLRKFSIENAQTSSKEPIRRSSTASHTFASFFPTSLLWKAAFALEVSHHVLEQDVEYLSFLYEDRVALANLAEALSDFATIGASCRDHTLQLVDFCEQQVVKGMKPSLFRKAESAILSRNGASPFADEAGLTDKKSASHSATKELVGEALWVAFQGVLRVAEILSAMADPEILLAGTFAPLLAVLQHYMKRVIACEYLVTMALEGFSTVAAACIPFESCTMQRKALLTSLCKLSLPTWGKHDSSSLLLDHHVRSLFCVLRIVHRFHNSISSEWDVILWTFEELSVMAIASPLLSDEAYHSALAIAAAYCRLPEFSTCLSDESLLQLAEAAADICKTIMQNRDVVGDSDIVLLDRASLTDASERGDGKESSISEKIVNIGVRAIYGNQSENIDGKPLDLQEDRVRKVFFQDYRMSFLQRLASSKNTVRGTSIERLPFSLMLLADVAIVNSFRSKPVNETLSSRMSSLAATSPAIRPFTSDMMTLLIMSRISNQPWLETAFWSQSKLVFLDPMQSQLLAVEPQKDTSRSDEQSMSSMQYDALSPLCSSIRVASRADIAVSSLGILKTIIEGAGHTLQGDVWPLIIEAISSLSGDKAYEIDRSGPEWLSCSLSAFKSLKLIVDDFLREILGPPAGASNSLLDCCSSFVTSEQDINTSLTAIGLLWTIADQDSRQNSTDRVLSRLVSLTSDQRAEVRNAAVNTLFSCIVGRGGGFSPAQWQRVFQSTIFVLVETLSTAASASRGYDKNEKATKKAVATHHSRDSSKKQWDTTNVLVLRGLGRVLRNFFLQLLDSSEYTEGDNGVSWFEDTWVHVLDIAYEAACELGGRDSIDIRSVGLETLALCCQLSSKAGIQAVSTPARVTANMEVVNGALRPVRTTPSSKSVFDRQQSVGTEVTRRNLFLEAFESLESYEEHLQLQVTIVTPKDQDTTIQVLQKFILGLQKVFDCCKDYEFSSHRMAATGTNGGSTETIDLESRFVRIVATVLAAAATNGTSKFLNQAQRSGIDLLRTMVSNGSSVALARLVEIAGSAFFIPKESKVYSDLNPCNALHFEASEIVSEQIVKEGIPDEVRVSVLHKILSTFLSDSICQRDYNRVIPIIEGGLKSASCLSQINGEVWQKEEDEIWRNVRDALIRMLTPINSTDACEISDARGVLTIVAKASASVPSRESIELGSTLMSGADCVLNVIKQSIESSSDCFNRETFDSYEELFRTCFSGVCRLNPSNLSLRTMVQHSLSQMLDSTLTSTQQCIYTKIGNAIIGSMINNESMEELTIFVFPQLCKLLSHEDEHMRLQVQKLLETVDLASYVKRAQERFEAAEKRATEAEHQIHLIKSKR